MKKILFNKLDEISQVIGANVETVSNLGVLDGLSGNMLFQFYYARLLNSDIHADLGTFLIAKGLKMINEGFGSSTYCSGIAGMGWTLDHLKQEGFIEIDNDAILCEFDSFMYQTMCNEMQAGNFDFLHGAMGYSFYFLNRYTNTESAELRRKYKDYILTFVDLLGNLGEKDNEKLKWRSPFDATGTKVYNLGLAHGITSIVNFLGRLHYFDDFKNETKELLQGGINYLMSKMDQDNPNSFCVFPSWESIDGTSSKKSRLAWCYGDLGVGATLWKISKILNDRSLESAALQTFRHAANRKTREQTNVIDATICHGAFGNALIFNQIYRQTKEKILGETSMFWMHEGLMMATYPDGYAGYKHYEGIGNLQPSLNLLMGIAGIGLAIIDHLTESSASWDECLMIS